MLEAVMLGHTGFQPVIEAIIRLAEKAAKEPRDFAPADNAAVEKAVLAESRRGRAAHRLQDHRQGRALQGRRRRQGQGQHSALTAEGYEPKFTKEQIGGAFHDLQAKVVRNTILDEGVRIDGRDVKTVRPIVSARPASCRAPTARLCSRAARRRRWSSPRSARARTSSSSTALEGTYKERFLLHYNFPPYSVGETGRMGSPGRREIGHGKLAWRAIRPMLPTAAEFPYTIRIVSEITESNGSSSMATVCGSSLALMDAGVPLKRPTAGIAMGLILEGERFAVLSDILGDEDHLGDMDFKVAGTEEGITSLQMDIKIAGITEEIMKRRPGPGQGRPPSTSSAR